MISFISNLSLRNATTFAYRQLSHAVLSTTTTCLNLPNWAKVASITALVGSAAIYKLVRYYHGDQIKTFDIDRFHIELYKRRNGLEIIQQDTLSGEVNKKFLYPHEKTYDLICDFEARLIADDEVALFLPVKKWSTSLEDFNVHIVYHMEQNTLLWKITTKETNQTYWLPFDQINASDKCCRPSAEFIKDLSKLPMKDIISLFNNELDVEKIEIDSINDKPTKIVLKPRHIKASLTDPSVVISNTKWITIRAAVAPIIK